MSIETQFYLLIGFFTGAESVDYLDYDLCSYYLISFAQKVLALPLEQRTEVNIPCLTDLRFIQKLEGVATNNPDKFDLNWFHFYFKTQINHV